MQESIVFLLRVQCRRKESSRSLSHLLMSFLFYLNAIWCCFGYRYAISPNACMMDVFTYLFAFSDFTCSAVLRTILNLFGFVSDLLLYCWNLHYFAVVCGSLIRKFDRESQHGRR